jgi:branched-chain amino acid transport system substrate-binding protein
MAASTNTRGIVRLGLLGLALVAAFALVVSAAVAADASRSQPLPPSFCSKVVSGGDPAPDYIIASDLGLQNGGEPAVMVAAIKFVLAQHGFKAGRYSVGYQSCDDSTPQNPQGDLAKCASNAKAYAANSSVVGVIGAWFSRCSAVELPIIERSPSGPLVLLSPNNTVPGLTHASGGSAPGEPRSYYPAGTRNFARLEVPDDFQGIAAAQLAKQLRLRNVFVLDDAEGYGLDVAGGFDAAAGNLGVSIAGSASWNGATSDFRSVVRRVARAHPAGVLLAGVGCPTCGSLIKQLRAALPKAAIFVPDAFSPVPALLKLAGSAAEGMYLLQPGLAPSKYGVVGQKLQRKFGTASTGSGGAPAAAQAAEILLASIAHSNGTRASVTSHVLAARVRGILGTFRFDANGDMSPGPVTIYRVTNGHQTINRVVRVSSKLLRKRPTTGP